MKRSLRVVVLVLTCLVIAPLAALETEVEQEIEFLLQHVGQSDLVFIRNRKEHDAAAARKHMLRKYDYFRDDVESAEQFIEYAATRSTMSGRLYTIRLGDGEEFPAGEYLLGVLATYRSGEVSPQPDSHKGLSRE